MSSGDVPDFKKKKKKRKGATVQREHSFNKRYFFSFRSKEENVTR